MPIKRMVGATLMISSRKKFGGGGGSELIVTPDARNLSTKFGYGNARVLKDFPLLSTLTTSSPVTVTDVISLASIRSRNFENSISSGGGGVLSPVKKLGYPKKRPKRRNAIAALQSHRAFLLFLLFCTTSILPKKPYIDALKRTLHDKER